MLLGFTGNEDSSVAKNLILIYFKMYVYQCKMLNCLPNLAGARNYIAYKHKIDRESTVINNTLQKINQVWIPFRKIMSL